MSKPVLSLPTRRRAPWRALSTIAILPALSGCGLDYPLTPIATREIEYNKQVEDIRDQAFLLNVIRAAYRRPLQFADVGALTGTTTTTAGLSLTAPFWARPLPSSAGVGTASGMVSGGPSFVLNPLATNEFYKGILSPVTSMQIARLVDEELPKSEIFHLAIERISYTLSIPDVNSPRGIVQYNKTFENHFGKNQDGTYQADPFDKELSTLIGYGLTIEPISSKTAQSPPLLAQSLPQLEKIKDLTAVAPGSSFTIYKGAPGKWDPSTADDENLTQEEADLLNNSRQPDHRTGIDHYFRLESSDKSAKFCFHPNDTNTALLGYPAGKLGSSAGKIIFPLEWNDNSQADGKPTSHTQIELDLRSFLCSGVSKQPMALSSEFHHSANKSTSAPEIKARLAASREDGLYQLTLTPALGYLGGPSIASDNKPIDAGHLPAKKAMPTNAPSFRISITIRSVEQMIYYLGEIARGELRNASKVDGIYLPADHYHDTAQTVQPEENWSRNSPHYPTTLAECEAPENASNQPKQCELIDSDQYHGIHLFHVYANKAADDQCLNVNAPLPGDSCIMTDFDGIKYSAKVDPSGADRTIQVMEILTQLTALNNSAKDLPPATTFNLISH